MIENRGTCKCDACSRGRFKPPEEIEQMLAWLDEKIKTWEYHHSMECVSSGMTSSQCGHARIEYASFLAQRDYLIRLRKELYEDNTN